MKIIESFGSLVFNEDAGAFARGADFANRIGQVAQLENRRVADLGFGLNFDDVLKRKAAVIHHPFVVERQFALAVNFIVKAH